MTRLGRERFFRKLRGLRPAPLAVLVKQILRINRTVVNTSHGRFWLDPISELGCAIATAGVYEAGMQQILKRFLSPGEVFVDLGANEGYFTVQAANLAGPNGLVIAVEPQDRLIPIIRENVRLNDLKNVTIAHLAVSDERGVASLHLTPNINTGASGFYRQTTYRLPTQRTCVITLAELLDRYHVDHVDLMKIDIESAEYEAILGSPRVFERRLVKALALELHPTLLAKRGKSGVEIESFLRKAGYERANEFANDVWVVRSE